MLTALANQGAGISAYSQLLTGFGSGMDLPTGTPTSWVVPSIDKLNGLIDFECDCVNNLGDFRTDSANSLAENRSAEETSKGFWVQGDFNFNVYNVPIRGNPGVRYVETEDRSPPVIRTGAPLTVENTYDDVLPAFNISVEPTEDFIVRFALG